MFHAFPDVIDFKDLLNSATGRLKKHSLFDERTEKASAVQYFQVRKNLPTNVTTVEPRLSGLVGTRRNSPDNRGSG